MVVTALAAVVKLDIVWLVSDVMNGLMALPNLIGLLLLSGFVLRETRAYFTRHGDGGVTGPGPSAASRGYSQPPTPLALL